MESVDFAPASEQVELSFSPIEKLPDALLVKIFSYLAFVDRYQLCLVSRKWSAASRTSWTNITFLNLNSIPRAMVNPILGLCPNVEIIEATDLTILLDKKQGLFINDNVRTMKLRNTKLALTDLTCGAKPRYLEAFRDHFERFPKLSELIFNNVSFTLLTEEVGEGFRLPNVTAASLRRLVLTDSAAVTCEDIDDVTDEGLESLSVAGENSIHVELGGMENLQCLYLQGLNWLLYLGAWDIGWPQLRELCIEATGYYFAELVEGVAGNKFPKLEVLICASDCDLNTASLSQLFTAKLALRVLVIAGTDEKLELNRDILDLEQQNGVGIVGVPSFQLPVTLPAPTRQILPEASAANRSHQSPLHIFVGGDFTKHVRFTLPPSDVAQFWCIDSPMPEYLAKEEVAEIFKGVFVAMIIRESPAWGSPDNTGRFFSTAPLLFHYNISEGI